MTPTPPKEQAGWKERFDTKFVGNSDLDYLKPTRPQELRDFIEAELALAYTQGEEAERARIIKWAEENHSHHAYADEELPADHFGCDEKDYPYVNSLALVAALSPTKEHNETTV